MPLRVRCPTGHKLIVPDDRAGRSLRCPRCGEVTLVPGERLELADRGQASGVRVQEPGITAEGTRRRDSGSVLDWPNSIAPPTAVATSPLDPAAVDQVMAGEAAPPPPVSIVEPAPEPVVKPKSRALPPRPAESIPAEKPLPPPRAEIPPAAVATPVEEAAPLVAPATPALPPIASPPATAAAAQRIIEPATTLPENKTLPPPTAEPEPPPIKEVKPPPVHSLVPDRTHQLAIYQLAAALVAAALFSVAPAIWDIVEYVQIPESQFVARWALVLLLLGAVQIAYTIYLLQLPDWTSVWVITVYLLFLAALYAAVLGLVLISSDSGLVVGALQLADKLAGGKAVLWCLCMVGISTILAFFAGRLSARWHKTEMFLRQTGLSRTSI